MRSRLIVFISIIQSILFLGHWFLNLTWASFWGGPFSSIAAKIIFTVLSVSFVLASLRAWYSHNPLVRLLYTISAVWLGFASYFMWASVLCWIVLGFARLAGLGWARQYIADVLFTVALIAGVYGLINAALLRITRITLTLPGLPQRWRGRSAALVSDTHLGHVRNGRFIRRVVRKLAALKPDVVLIAGDLYDGTSADFERLANPWRELTRAQSEAVVPHGVFYIAGNHEEFYSDAEYLGPLLGAGVRELNNEKAEIDGLQVVGVHYRDAAHPERYSEILRRANLDRARASILLLHAPVHLEIAEAEGVTLQLSGHTHGGQFFPYTWIARRVWGKLLHGLQRWGSLQIFITYGAGTWGPPLRVGTRPEIVVITFQ